MFTFEPAPLFAFAEVSDKHRAEEIFRKNQASIPTQPDTMTEAPRQIVRNVGQSYRAGMKEFQEDSSRRW